MAIPTHEREKMLAVRLCGPRVMARLESIGITKLEDLADRDPHQLVHHVNVAAERPIWRPPNRGQVRVAAARLGVVGSETDTEPIVNMPH